MRNILQFLRSLTPSFKRDDLVEAIRQLREGVVDQTLPPFQTTLADFPSAQFKSKVAQDYAKNFDRFVDTSYRGNWLVVTNAVLTALPDHIDRLLAAANKAYGSTISVAGINYQKATILQLLAITDFAVRYSRQMLLYVLAAEANVKAKTLATGKERPQPEINWLEQNQRAYFTVLGVLSVKGQDLIQDLFNIPEVTITDENVDTVEETVGIAKVDPFGFNLLPATNWNPFFFFGMMWANMQIARWERAKNEKRALEFRLEQLRGQKVDREDAKLESTIAVYENEVNKLAAKIAKLEE